MWWLVWFACATWCFFHAVEKQTVNLHRRWYFLSLIFAVAAFLGATQ